MADIIAFPGTTGQQQTVLVVDDEPVIRAVVCECLRDSGFHSLAVETADAAVEMIRNGVAIDLVFSDVRMPGELDGFGLARWIMQHRSDIPVILVSGDIGKANAAVELCGAEIFAKPYDFKAAVRKIHETIERHRKRRA